MQKGLNFFLSQVLIVQKHLHLCPIFSASLPPTSPPPAPANTQEGQRGLTILPGMTLYQHASCSTLIPHYYFSLSSVFCDVHYPTFHQSLKCLIFLKSMVPKTALQHLPGSSYMAPAQYIPLNLLLIWSNLLPGCALVSRGYLSTVQRWPNLLFVVFL